MFDDIVRPKAKEPKEHYEYIDLLGKKCTYCPTLGLEPGIYRKSHIEMHKYLYVICTNCAHQTDRFIIYNKKGD